MCVTTSSDWTYVYCQFSYILVIDLAITVSPRECTRKADPMALLRCDPEFIRKEIIQMPVAPAAAAPKVAAPQPPQAAPPGAQAPQGGQGKQPQQNGKDGGNLPPIVFLYQPKEKGAKPVQAPTIPFKLMPGKEGVAAKDLEPTPATSWDDAMKIARARVGVAALGQAQVIVKDAKEGAFLVAGLAHVQQTQGKDGKPTASAIPAMLDGAKFDSVFGAVAVAKTVDSVQAIVGSTSWVDLRKAAQGKPQAFEGAAAAGAAKVPTGPQQAAAGAAAAPKAAPAPAATAQQAVGAPSGSGAK